MKALVLFSGGLDSSVCLGLAVKEFGVNKVLALSVFYGQKHKKEIDVQGRRKRPKAVVENRQFQANRLRQQPSC